MDQISILQIPKNVDHRGNLSVIDIKTCLPFELKRVFYVYDMPAGVERGGHAHFKLHQFLWCVSGSVVVSTIDRKSNSKDYTLSLPWEGLYMPPMTWAKEASKTAGCVYLVAASDYYDPEDYIHDFDQFQKLVQNS